MEPAFSAALHLVLGALVVGEVVAYHRLVGAYVAAGLRFEAPAGDLPAIPDLSVLDDLRGVCGPLRYRWDPERRLLLFGRALGVVRGERGHAVGAVHFGPDGRPSVWWRPAPAALLPAILVSGCYGTVALSLAEGEPAALIGVPLLAAVVAVIGAFQWSTARGTLARVLLPRLAEVLRERR